MGLLRELRGLRPSAQWVCENAELGQGSLGIARGARALFQAARLYDPELGTGGVGVPGLLR